jgi:hypothetical protein
MRVQSESKTHLKRDSGQGGGKIWGNNMTIFFMGPNGFTGIGHLITGKMIEDMPWFVESEMRY